MEAVCYLETSEQRFNRRCDKPKNHNLNNRRVIQKIYIRLAFIVFSLFISYSKMDKRAKDKLIRSPRENGGGYEA